MYIIFVLLLAISAIIMPAIPQEACAQSVTGLDAKDLTGTPAVIKADTITYDTEKSVVTASGNVEITQGNRVLLADSLMYDKNNNFVNAKGNISLIEPSGTVIFADNVELKDDLKTGIVNNFGARFPDNSVVAASKGERVDENTIVMERVVYSPCPVCKENPDKDPLWQVAARKATIDDKDQRVTYNNAFFEIYGVPALYTPYFSHPTPNADRKSGFLTPKYTHDQIFGTSIKTPYYYNIATNMDATITPIITSNEGPILAGEFRHLVPKGEYFLKGSITNPERVDSSGNKIEGHDVRGHIEGAGNFAINDVWDWGFQGKRASDDTYLKRYSFGDEDVLTSSIHANKIEERDHTLVKAITFQGLKTTDDPGETPLILPYGESHIERKLDGRGTRFAFDSNILALTRDEGTSSNRLSLKGTVSRPLITKSGSVFEAAASLRGDGYIVDDVTDPANPTNTLEGSEERVIPEASLKWSLPMVKNTQERNYLIEPVTNFVISPGGGNPDIIPNEDSQDIEFSAENLFDNNHFSGYDRVETGPRVNYGLRAGASDYSKGDVNFLFGQSYRADKNEDFTVQSGLSDHFSDYVGKLSYNKNSIFDVAYKFRFDKDSFEIRNNTVSGNVNYAPVRFTLDYVAVNENSAALDLTTTTDDDREIIIAGTSIDLSDKWVFEANGNRNLASGEWVSTKSGFTYKGACMDFSFDWLREYTRDRDIQPNSTFSFQVNLKNMGYR